ncbi:MAG TPA: epoxyqueuosine reductase QueH [Bacillota bacterium]|nr:epoxyqueuosine reductase QueH [Bacillota bacterium]
MKILLHTCCGPCSIYPAEYLKGMGMDVTGFFFNPNIHPYTEFVKRKETLEKYAPEIGLKVIFDGSYLLEDFLRGVAGRETDRCRFCYEMRLDQTARAAREGKFDCFSTTLLVSPFQKHELIREVGLSAGEKHGVPFYCVDFRSGYRGAAARSRELGMYRQKYCGCIYSEKDRYLGHRGRGAG